VVTDLVQAASFTTRVEADLARLYLESHGIYAVVFDGDAYNYSDGALIGVRVMVLGDEFADARKLLGDYEPRADARSGRGRNRPG
jgi:hypothetical protein